MFSSYLPVDRHRVPGHGVAAASPPPDLPSGGGGDEGIDSDELGATHVHSHSEPYRYGALAVGTNGAGPQPDPGGQEASHLHSRTSVGGTLGPLHQPSAVTGSAPIGGGAAATGGGGVTVTSYTPSMLHTSTMQVPMHHSGESLLNMTHPPKGISFVGAPAYISHLHGAYSYPPPVLGMRSGYPPSHPQPPAVSASANPVAFYSGPRGLMTLEEGPCLEEEQPVYVNPKQYNRIIKRRQQRAQLEREMRITLMNKKKPYIHESRHKHAMRRPRGPGGRFLPSTKSDAIEMSPGKCCDDSGGPNTPTGDCTVDAAAAVDGRSQTTDG
eukprot:GHVU01032266.1.p1 GENE.GHVU01032266.1~~GHVU01032266.1.p1  ORF type:complete len:326 (+),score=34.26 GHVU01032266.1:426-1403(+)